MIKQKIQRAKTQKKQNRSILPELRPGKRFVTVMSFNDPTSHETRKLSENSAAQKISNHKKIQIKRNVDENQIQIFAGKNSVKFSKKKLNNQLMMIQQITPNTCTLIKNPSSSNLVDFASDQYQGQRQYNQDRVLLSVNVKILSKTYNFFGVFDGHGGYAASQFAKLNFVKYFEEQMNLNPMFSIIENLRKSICKLETKICEISKSKSTTGGTCASILLISDNSYYVAHLGDSRILRIKDSDQGMQYEQITTDHKPDDRNQKIRIESVGGKVYRNKVNLKDDLQSFGPYRVFPGKLSVSRSLGDYDIKKQPSGQAISWEPQLLEGKIQQKSLFLIFSDGAYEKFTNKQIVEHFAKSKSIQDISIRKSMQSFLINSILRQSTDNISILAVSVKPN